MINQLKNKYQKGMTLMEVAVTIAVTGILMSVAIPTYVNLQTSAATSALQSNVAALQSAFVMADAAAGAAAPLISAVTAGLNMQNATIVYTAGTGYTITLTGRTSNAVIPTTTSTTNTCASPTANGAATGYLCTLGAATITP